MDRTAGGIDVAELPVRRLVHRPHLAILRAEEVPGPPSPLRRASWPARRRYHAATRQRGCSVTWTWIRLGWPLWVSWVLKSGEGTQETSSFPLALSLCVYWTGPLALLSSSIAPTTCPADCWKRPCHSHHPRRFRGTSS